MWKLLSKSHVGNDKGLISMMRWRDRDEAHVDGAFMCFRKGTLYNGLLYKQIPLIKYLLCPRYCAKNPILYVKCSNINMY